MIGYRTKHVYHILIKKKISKRFTSSIASKAIYFDAEMAKKERNKLRIAHAYSWLLPEPIVFK